MGCAKYFCVSILVVFIAIALAPLTLQSDTMAMYGDAFNLVTSNVNSGRNRIFDYSNYWYGETGTVEERASNAQTLTNHYYDLVTDFFEYGWGQSFHFAPRFLGEAFDASLARHEYWLATKIGLRPGFKALDVGCGVGGPMRAIARFSGANIVGLNNNKYQIGRGEKALKMESLDNLCSFSHGDFMNMSFDDNTFDAAYAIEATCHAPDKVGVYKEIYRVVKPGGLVGLYEWVMTDQYNSSDPAEHAIKLGIEHGDSLPTLPHWSVVVDAVQAAGFEVVEHFDVAEQASKSQKSFNVPWYRPLEPHFTLTGFKHTPPGRLFTAYMVRFMEFLGVAPAGSYATAMMLEDGAHNLMLGGQQEIFTPMYWVLIRKPMTPKKGAAAAAAGAAVPEA